MKKDRFRMAEDPFYNPEQVVSATECTGLIPAAAEEEQAEEYAELYAIHSPEKKEDF